MLQKKAMHVWLDGDGGNMVPRDGTIGRFLQVELKHLIRHFVQKTMIPISQETAVRNFHLKVQDLTMLAAVPQRPFGRPRTKP